MGKLKCEICGDLFECDHKVMVEYIDGIRLSHPHCKHCYFDYGKCSDNHGYQCGNCEKMFAELNPSLREDDPESVSAGW